MKKYSDRPKWKGIYLRKTQDGDTVFYVTYSVNNKVRWIKVGTKWEGCTVTEARKKRIDLLRTTAREKKGSTYTIDGAWEKYLEMMETDKFRAIKSERSRYEVHIRSRLGLLRLQDVMVPLVKKFQSELNEKGLQPSTVYEILQTLSRVYSYAKKCGYTGHNPVRDADFKNVRVQRKRFLTVKQADQFLRECRKINKKLYQMCAFALYAGLRMNEVMQLNRDRVNIYSREITVRTKHNKRLYKERQAIILEQLVPVVHTILKDHPRSIHEPFFKGAFNYDQFHQAVNACGFNDERDKKNRAEWFTFHSLRHTYGSLLAQAGIPPITIMEMMGHETMEATLIYTHVHQNQMHEAAKKLGGMYKDQLTKENKSNLRRVI
jgi:integrase